jgi:exodeoxyribonuclease VII small subunit
MASEAQKDTFEALYTRLEETVAKLEAGDLGLEESISLYEEGMKLAVRCQEMLEQADLRVTRLQAQFAEASASLRETPAEYLNADAEADPDPE